MEETLDKRQFLSLDRFLGVLIMGATGGTIGFYLGGILLVFSGLFLGSVLGYAVAGFGARLFFVSVLVGLLMGVPSSVFLLDVWRIPW